MVLQTVSHVGTQEPGKVTKCLHSVSQARDSHNHSKIDENEQLDLKVPAGCPCGSLDHQKVTQDTKMESRGLQNHSLRLKSESLQQSTRQQLPVDKGPAAGTKP